VGSGMNGPPDELRIAKLTHDKEIKMSKEYEIHIQEQDADYDQDAGFRVVVCKPGLPPHSSEFFKTKAEAEARKRELRKSLP
jgi:hypothetical protein